jgi:hypothetical protein
MMSPFEETRAMLKVWAVDSIPKQSKLVLESD